MDNYDLLIFGKKILRLFSIGFLLRSFYLGLKYPSLLLSHANSNDIGKEIDRKRKEEWRSRREHYRDHPKRIFGFQIYLNPRDFSPVSTSIGTIGWLDLSLTELLFKVLKPGMIVVDVGANIGYYTLLSAKIVGSSGLVCAFEPEPLNLELLNKSITANDLRHVKVYNRVLSETHGPIKLHLSDPRERQAHSISRDWGRGSIEVCSTTLDSFWESLGKPHFNLIKIHVGDNDLIVLRGAKKVIHESKPFIVIVFIQDQWKDDIDFLDDLFTEYDVYRVVKSPFLIRRVHKADLFSDQPIQLFLAPVAISKVR